MKKYVFEMWITDQPKMSLADVLSMIKGEGLEWHFSYLEGISRKVPNGTTEDMVEFMDSINDLHTVWILDWKQLNDFALSLEDMHDGVLIGSGPLDKDSFIYNIEAFDSTLWEISTNEVINLENLTAYFRGVDSSS